MFLFPEIQLHTDAPGYRLVQEFLTVPYWDAEYDRLFAADISVEFPYAPPGMLQHMIPFEFEAYRYWMRNTVREWNEDAPPAIIPTTDPDIFWAIRWSSGKVYWAQRECDYKNEFVYRITLRNGKIQSLREYANPIAYYDALGILLPNFNYLLDTVREAPACCMEKGAVSHFTPEENLRRAVRNFADPINGYDDDPEPIYGYGMVEVTPYAPLDMMETWTGKDFDIQTEWMFRNVPEWNVIDKAPFYQSTDPNVIVVESYGYGKTAWSNRNGHYIQRELQIVHLDEQGKIDHFRVYFNPIHKLSSMNQSVPSFPYFNF